jgi:hypothetical protein
MGASEDARKRIPRLFGSQSSVAVDTAARVHHRTGTAFARTVASGRIEVVRELVDTAIAAQDDHIDVSTLVAKASDDVRPALEVLKTGDRRSFIKRIAAVALFAATDGVADEAAKELLFGSERADQTTITENVIVEPSGRGQSVSRAEGDAMWAEIRRLAESLQRFEEGRNPDAPDAPKTR